MKKLFILSGVALIALASCTKIEPAEVPAKKITFQTVNYMSQTKAGEVSVLDDFNEFKCLAFLHAEGIDLDSEFNVKTDSYQEFFGASGETISPYDENNAKMTNLTSESTGISYWAPSHDYYWPKGTHSFVNFAGWYGTTGSAASDPDIDYAYNTTTNKWTATLTWDFSNSTVGAAGANLLYSDMAWRYNDNPDAVYKKNGLANNYKGVPMLFHHALAQINVKAYAAAAAGYTALSAGTGTVTDGLATWTITLENVKINNIYNQGTLTMTNADPGTSTTQAWTGSWAGTGSKGTLVPANFTVQKVTEATAEDLIAKTCVLPQTIGEDVTLTFDMRIKTQYTDNYNFELIPITIKLNDMSTTAWAQNTKYTYYLIINPSQKTVRFDPALEADWSEVSAGSTTL